MSNTLRELPKLINAFKLITDDPNIAISQAEAVMSFGIPNMTNFNPKYTVLAYVILISTQQFDVDEDKIFITKKNPERPEDYAFYNGKSLFDYLKMMFPDLTISSKDAITKHLEMVLTYLDTFRAYLANENQDLAVNEVYEFDEEAIFAFEDDDLD